MDSKSIEEAIQLVQDKFKAQKSRSVVIRKGKVVNNCSFKLQGEDIPTLREVPIKWLGKWHYNSLDDKENVRRFIEENIEGLGKMEGRQLPGKFKIWVLQYTLIPKLRWPMML